VTITQAGGGGFHTGYALASDGSIYAWGQNESGQLGNGTITSTTPTPGLVQTPAVAVFDVSFADVAGTSLTGDSNSWNVVTPQAAPDVCGPVDVTLTYTIGAGSLFTETLPGGFTYDTPCAPTGLSAVAGNASAIVYFTTPADGGSPITGYTVTATPISGGAPVFATGTGSPILAPGLTNGETYILTVYASNANGDGLESAISNPVTPSAPPPVITEVNPSSGPTAGGTSVTITGANFTGTTEVTFGGVAALFLVSSDTSITAITPAGEAGTVDVQVTTSVSASALVPEDKFTYVSGFCDATDTIFCDGFDG
jgi:hypothetical protein